MGKAKRLQVLGCAAAAVLGFSTAAQAGLLIYEPFDYTTGQAIAGQANTTSAAPETWFDAGTVTAPAHQVTTSGLSGPAGFPQGGSGAIGNAGDLKLSDQSEMNRLNIPFAFNGITPNYGANSTLYYSLLLNIASITGLTTAHSNANANNDFIIGLNNTQGSQAARPNSWGGELAIRLGATAGTYNLGVRASTTTAGTTYWTGDLTPDANTTHLVVVEAHLGTSPGTVANDLNAMWLDPGSAGWGLDESTRPAPDGSSNGAASATDANDFMASLLIGAGIAAGSNPNDVNVDEIRVGETWADVTSQTAFVVPEPAGLSLLGLGALGLVRRRRQ